eukprot:CAMPEP_0181315952 /NCGR_PEP_ID=MMETSP1101-20121128/15641_1 /TAXON_ID=46948 /ORGANISM="Rhodomonas abbreviata, Strain Caron Lab Isolate" /LENGTH=213 /DNA_ID=CAMNT_0023423177 /DNA_START=42 /DNA_END=683 /DNA_ORIENTATION=+
MTDQQAPPIPKIIFKNRANRVIEVFIGRDAEDVDLKRLNRGEFFKPGIEYVPSRVQRRIVLAGTDADVSWDANKAYVTVIAQSSTGQGDYVPYENKEVEKGKALIMREEKFNASCWRPFEVLQVPEEDPNAPVSGAPPMAGALAMSPPFAGAPPMTMPMGVASPPMAMRPGFPAPAPMGTTVQYPTPQFAGQSVQSINGAFPFGGQTMMIPNY